MNKDAITILANTTATLDPSGYYGADKIQEDTTTNDHAIGNSTVAVGSGESATFSAFLKAAERNWAALRLYTGSGSKFAYFNLSNGTLGSVDSGATATIVSYGNGWYRCSITITMVSVSISLPYVYASVGDGMRYYAGTTGSGIYCWGFQHEKAAYATSYMGPTLAAAVTRGEESASKTSATALIGQTEGTMFAEIDWDGRDKDSMFFTLSYGTTNNRMHIGYDESANRYYFNIRVAGVQQALIVQDTPASGIKKIAAAYKANDAVLYINGVQVGSSTSTSVAATSRIDIGNYYATGFQYPVKQALLFKTRLSNDSLAALTA